MTAAAGSGWLTPRRLSHAELRADPGEGQGKNLAAVRRRHRLPATVNWYDAYHVVRDDVVIDVWPVIPRGPGHHGLANLPGQADESA